MALVSQKAELSGGYGARDMASAGEEGLLGGRKSNQKSCRSDSVCSEEFTGPKPLPAQAFVLFNKDRTHVHTAFI